LGRLASQREIAKTAYNGKFTGIGVGQIDRDQVASYAQRKGWTIAEAERWLSPNLGYEPGAAADAA